MIPLTGAERAVYYPADRRFRNLDPTVSPDPDCRACLVPLSVAWIEARLWGLPFIAPNPAAMPGAASGPHGFPTKMKSTSICCLVFDAIHHMGAQVAHWARAKYQCQDLYW